MWSDYLRDLIKSNHLEYTSNGLKFDEYGLDLNDLDFADFGLDVNDLLNKLTQPSTPELLKLTPTQLKLIQKMIKTFILTGYHEADVILLERILIEGEYEVGYQSKLNSLRERYIKITKIQI